VKRRKINDNNTMEAYFGLGVHPCTYIFYTYRYKKISRGPSEREREREREREMSDLQHVGSSPESSQIFSTEYIRVPNPTSWIHT
jgi:hypothetical protein